MTELSWPSQEVVRAPLAMVASVNALASSTGMAVLRDGGNAVDAAVAMGAVLAVVEPWSGQLGGDAFLLHRSNQGRLLAINGSGAAPIAATLERYRGEGGIPETGWLAATVPGVVDAWQVVLDRLGTRPLRSLLEPAIEYAETGFSLTDRQCRLIAEMAQVASRFPETAAAFLRGGRPPTPDDRFRQPELARTLRVIQSQGAGAFYHGEIAAALVAASTRGGGLFTERDFAEHRTLVQEPLGTTYRGWTVIEQPPVSQGLVVLMALRTLEQFDLPRQVDADLVHLQVEAHKLALADRLHHVGDPDFAPVPVAELLSDEHARRRSRTLDRQRSLPIEVGAMGHPDTTYLCVVDRDRNAVSYIHSLYGGNGVIAGDTGILLNNRMRCFSMDEGSPNLLHARKRPVHTLNSWMLLHDGKLRFLGGTPGSFWQIQTNLQVIMQLVDLAQDLRSAVDAPRWTMGPQADWADASLKLEGRFAETVIDGLVRRGHQVTRIGDWGAGGAVQTIELESNGMLAGAGDPRPGTSAVSGY